MLHCWLLTVGPVGVVMTECPGENQARLRAPVEPPWESAGRRNPPDLVTAPTSVVLARWMRLVQCECATVETLKDVVRNVVRKHSTAGAVL